MLSLGILHTGGDREGLKADGLYPGSLFLCKEIMELTIEEVFESYYECRKSKRYSKGALQFEVNYEENLIRLYEELRLRTWKPGKSSCFIVTKPVRREIFAAPFRDRIVHHILIRRLNPSLEKYFIHGSYACRTGKGTHAAIRKVEHYIKSTSCNGHKQAYILKLDIKGFFMSIDRQLLWQRLERFIDTAYKSDCTDKSSSVDFEKYLAKTIIFNEPTQNCMLRSPKAEWELLPKDKSMFTAQSGCALPISESKDYLKAVIKQAKSFLERDLYLKLHPKKIYLQSARYGVPFLGTFIKPLYTVSSRRVKNNFVETLKKYAYLADDHLLTYEEKTQCRASINSYLGIMAHYKTYTFRKKQLLHYFKNRLKKHFFILPDVKRICLQKIYKKLTETT